MSYPIDESPLGLFDMGGSAREWLADWDDEAHNKRLLAGGSWANANPKVFELWGRGCAATFADGTVGFRLVRRRP